MPLIGTDSRAGISRSSAVFVILFIAILVVATIIIAFAPTTATTPAGTGPSSPLSVACSSPVVVDTISVCTATFTGKSGSMTGKMVQFNTNGGGDWYGGAACYLSGDSCSVNWRPETTSAPNPETITAYLGTGSGEITNYTTITVIP